MAKLKSGTRIYGSATVDTNLTVSGDGFFSNIALFDDNVPSHYLTITNSANLTATRTLSVNVNDADRTISLSGNLTLANSLTTSGNFAVTFTATGATTLTLPTTGTLATLADITASVGLSASTTSTQSGYFGDIFLFDDSTPSHYLQITNSANLTAARSLSVNVNDANRTVSLSGDLTISSTATVSGTNTGDQTITLTGDVTGTGTGSFGTTLANSGVTAGTYNDSATAVRPFTVDAKGRITSIGTAVTTTPAFSSITSKPTTLSGYGITDALSRLVVTTAVGGIAAADGPNTWAKIATFSTGTNQFADCTLILGISSSVSTLHDTAIVSVYFRSNVTNENPTVDVEILSKGGNTSGHIVNDSFKMISGAWSTNMELWMKKAQAYGQFNIFELSRRFQGGTLTYHDAAPWQAATPTGATNNVSSDGVTSGLKLTANSRSSAADWVITGNSIGVANASGLYQDSSNNMQFAARDGSGTLRLVLDSNNTSGSYLNTTAGFAIGSNSTTPGYTTLATNLRLGVSTKTGTYSNSAGGTVITITCTNHGLTTGDSVYIDYTSGTAGDSYYNQVTVTNSSTFTVTGGVIAAANSAQSCTIYPETQIRFPGAFGDGGNTFDHTVISERIYGAGDDSELLIYKGNDGGTSIQDNIRLAATGDIYFHSGTGTGVYSGFINSFGNSLASSTVSILASGNVGVGTVNPGAKLEVFGTSRFGGTTSAGRRADIATDGILTLAYGNNTNTSNLILQNISDVTSTTNHGNSILWQFGTNTTTTAISAGRINILKEQQWTTTASTQDSYFSVDLAVDGTLTERLKVTSAGNLTANGSVTASNDVSLGGELNFSNANNKYIDFYTTDDVTNYTAHLRLVNNASSSFHLGMTMARAGAVTLYHNNSAKLATSADGASVTGNLTVSGNLTINGTTTTINSTVTTLDDPIITLGGDTSVAEVTKDRGIEFKWGGVAISVSNYVGVGTALVTANVASTTGYETGDIITISGATGTEQAKLNGTWIISVLNGTQFSFSIFPAILTTGTYSTTIGTTVKSNNGFFGFDQSAQRLTFIPRADAVNEVYAGTRGDFEIGNIIASGALTGSVRPRTAVTSYRDHSVGAFDDAPIYSRASTEDNWIYCDTANAQWGIYHRNIDSTLVVSGQPDLPQNSIAFIGGNNLTAYVNLANGNVYCGDIIASGGDITTGAAVASNLFGTTTTAAIEIGGALTTGTIRIGSTTGSGAINIGNTGTAAAQTVNIATATTGTITIGGATSLVNIATGSATGTVQIGTTTAAAQQIIIGSGTTSTISIGGTGSPVNIATGASTGAIQIGSTTASAQNITIGGTTTGTINIGSVSGANTINVGSTSSTAVNLPTGKTKVGQTFLLQGGAVNITLPTLAGTLYASGNTDVALADGGTNASLTAVSGGVVYSSASALAITAAGTAGQTLVSTGAGIPRFVNSSVREQVRLASGTHEAAYYGPSGSSSTHGMFRSMRYSIPYNSATVTTTTLSAPRTSFTGVFNLSSGLSYFNYTGSAEFLSEFNFRASDYITVTGTGISTASTTATGTSGTNTITVTSATNIVIGQYVKGTGIGIDCFVTNVSGTTITLSVNNTATVSGTITFNTIVADVMLTDTSGNGTISLSTSILSSQTAVTLTFTQPSWALSIDGVTPTAGVEFTGDRVLLTSQGSRITNTYAICPGDSKRNGIYYVSTGGTSWVLTRTSDANTTALLQRPHDVHVTGGTASTFIFSSSGLSSNEILGTTPISYFQNFDSRSAIGGHSYFNDALVGRGYVFSGDAGGLIVTSSNPIVYNCSAFGFVAHDNGHNLNYNDSGAIRFNTNSFDLVSELTLAFKSGATVTGQSAVNYLGITNAITTVSPKIEAVGTDTNIGINLVAKGTGSVTITGNLNIASNKNITADFTNATLISRTYLQTSTANSSTFVTSIPSGSGSTSAFYASNNSIPTNAPYVGIHIDGSNAYLRSYAAGSGAALPLTIETQNRTSANSAAITINTGTTTTSGTTGAISIRTGNSVAVSGDLSISTGTGTTSGSITIDVGNATTDGTITIGGTNAASVTLPSGRTLIGTSTLTQGSATARTITFPDATTTLVGTDATQTLSNKTYLIPYTEGAGTSLTIAGEATNQPLFPFTNDTITLAVGLYEVNMILRVTRGTMSTTTAALRINILGTGNAAGSFIGNSISSTSDTGLASSIFQTPLRNINENLTVTSTSSTNGASYIAQITGIIKITTAGTIIPAYSLSVNLQLTNATATVCSSLNYMRLLPISTSGTTTVQGGWS